MPIVANLINDSNPSKGCKVPTIEIEIRIVKNILSYMLFVGYMLFICIANRDPKISTLFDCTSIALHTAKVMTAAGFYIN